MSDGSNAELAKHRRNLMLISVALLLYQFAGGSVDNISIFGGGFKLENGQLAIVFAYITLFYFTWRFWVHASPQHADLSRDMRGALESAKCYRRLVQPRVDTFRKDSGIEDTEWFKAGFAGVTADEEGKRLIPVPITISIKRGFFSRSLKMDVHNPTGEFSPDTRLVPLSYLRVQTCWMLAAVNVIVNKKSFSELVVPYYWSLRSSCPRVGCSGMYKSLSSGQHLTTRDRMLGLNDTWPFFSSAYVDRPIPLTGDC